ncbi:hypothetical protein UWK_00726 [Desulfocapsa sulfexigens DSM 10523]|uniref:Uncharacterized protein n=1 Tax=Desulfocapsa sulfexigens (strain DSM 10523 / SB164P1) TaxID=1167006 RepID=M1NBX6_DESSD|nr:hypothetical protein [Desulfocapsa sulfexigens]AGF77304.1 hypothetical protein UWK_00726 [Desulfocapsa sulfexigens DSM 10523]
MARTIRFVRIIGYNGTYNKDILLLLHYFILLLTIFLVASSDTQVDV